MVIPEDQKTNEQKLEEEIAELKTKIKNTEYDLAHMFKGNKLIEEKLLNSQNLLKEKQMLLSELTGKSIDKSQEIRNAEDEITEKSSVSISKTQKEILDEMIEEEFV